MTEITYTIVSDGSRFDIVASVRDAGEDLLVFLHGLGCSKSTWRDVWSRREFDSFSILCLDLPGHGNSDRPTAFSYAMEDYAIACADVLSFFPSKRIHIVGHSMGGAIGLLLPGDVLLSAASFVNVEGNMTPEDCAWASRRTISVPYEQFLADAWPGFVKDYEDEGKRFHSLDRVSPDAFYRSAESLVEWSDNGRLLRAYRDLVCRKLYICGDRNADHPTVSSLERLDVEAIPNSGHFSMIDNPDGFYAALRRLVEMVH